MSNNLNMTLNTNREDHPVQVLVLYHDEIGIIERLELKDTAQLNLIREFNKKWMDLFLKNSKEDVIDEV